MGTTGGGGRGERKGLRRRRKLTSVIWGDLELEVVAGLPREISSMQLATWAAQERGPGWRNNSGVVSGWEKSEITGWNQLTTGYSEE